MKFDAPVLLVGNGPVEGGAVALANAFAKLVVAADGGATTALRYDLDLSAVIGDFDSADSAAAQESFGEIIKITSQETTDFEKCLETIDAPLILGVGFLGGRLDHELAALNALVRIGKNVVLIGEVDIVFRLPPQLELALPTGTRISFFPMGPVTGVKSAGLAWELNGLALNPDGKISTSNQTSAAHIVLENPDQPLLCLLPRETLSATLTALNPD